MMFLFLCFCLGVVSAKPYGDGSSYAPRQIAPAAAAYPPSPYIYLGRQDLPSIYPVVTLNPSGSIFRPFSLAFLNRNEVIDRLIARLNSLRGRPGGGGGTNVAGSRPPSATEQAGSGPNPRPGIFNDEALMQTVATTEQFLDFMSQGVRNAVATNTPGVNPTEVVEAVPYREGYLLKQADGSILYTRDVPVGEKLDQEGAVFVGQMAPSRPNLATRFRQAMYNEDPQVPTLSGPNYQNVLSSVPPVYLW